jgi:hypothetical protein
MRVNKFHSKQLDQSDFGVVCLQTILKYYNSNYSLEKLREYSGGWAWAIFVAGALLGGVIYDAAKWLICENNEAYGANMMASGSAGGHK